MEEKEGRAQGERITPNSLFMCSLAFSQLSVFMFELSHGGINQFWFFLKFVDKVFSGLFSIRTSLQWQIGSVWVHHSKHLTAFISIPQNSTEEVRRLRLGLLMRHQRVKTRMSMIHLVYKNKCMFSSLSVYFSSLCFLTIYCSWFTYKACQLPTLFLQKQCSSNLHEDGKQETAKEEKERDFSNKLDDIKTLILYSLNP